MGDFDSFWGKPSLMCFGKPIEIDTTTSLEISSKELHDCDKHHYDSSELCGLSSSVYTLTFEIADDGGMLKALLETPKPPKLPRKIKKMVKKQYIVDCPKKIGKWYLAIAWSFNTKKRKWLNGISFNLTHLQE